MYYLWHYLQNQIAMREYIKKPESQSRTLDNNPKAVRQVPLDVILQQYKERNIQKHAKGEDEELMQGKFDTVITARQEKYLPHEAWHVALQKQGRVQPIIAISGMAVNGNADLEHESDVMGGKAVQRKREDDEMSDKKDKPAQMIMQNVTQRNVATARTFRQQAQNLPPNGRHPTNPDTAATSETLYALTPDPGAVFRRNNAAIHFQGKNLAGPVPGAFMSGNHAERKLIFHGGANVRNIGVDRDTCQACVNAICAQAGQIQHVSEPSGTYLVTPGAMRRVGN